MCRILRIETWVWSHFKMIPRALKNRLEVVCCVYNDQKKNRHELNNGRLINAQTAWSLKMSLGFLQSC